MNGLTIGEMLQAGNRIISQNLITMSIVTKYGKDTLNYWQSYDDGKTFINYDCRTV